jgi:PAS domain S-box-containing protein
MLNSQDFDNFFNSLELLLFVLDIHGNIIYCNDTACARLEFTRAELLDTPVVNIHPPEQRMFAGMLIDDMLKGKVDVCLIPIQTKSGKLIPVKTTVTLGSWQGEPALFGVTKDITDVKLIDDKYQTIFNAIPDLVALLDLDYKILEINKAMEDKLGVTKDKVIGEPCYKVIHDTTCPPKFCPNVRLLEDEQIHSSEVFEPRLEGNYLVTVSPVRDIQGKLTGSVHIAHNITQIKLSEQKFSTIFQFTPVALAITRIADGLILDVNDAWLYLTGYCKEEVIGKTIYDLHLYENNKDRDVLVEKLKDNHRLENEPIIMRTKHGLPIYGLFCGAPIMIDGIPCWITALNNQTSKVLLEKAIINFRDTVIIETRNDISQSLKDGTFVK